MIKIKNAVSSPPGIFVLYILASAAAIMGFRLIFPGEAAPLSHLFFQWRLTRGFLDFLVLFPALALSSLVIPFGFKIRAKEKINPFSSQFLDSLKLSIITVIAAAAAYGLLFSLALPLATDYEADLRFRGRLYQMAKERAQENAAGGEWNEAAQLVSICEMIWPNGPEIAKLKTEAEIQTHSEHVAADYHSNAAGDAASASREDVRPASAAEVLRMAETALDEERYFDAHWLATLGSRLAGEGSAEKALATRIAGRAWNGVGSMAPDAWDILSPNARETEAHRIYRLKRQAYEALLGDEWIRAYFIFRELLSYRPDDPDAIKYLAMSESGVKEVAFFIDEMELALGRILTGAVFSLPSGPGRMVIRFSSLSTSLDSAYGIGIEIMAFDRDGRPVWSMEAPYAKIMPLSLDSGPGVTVLMRALDRDDKTKQWDPIVRGSGQSDPGGAKIVLPVSWENFLLLTKVRRGFSALSPADLMRAAENLGNYGYQGQVFEAELLRRFAEPLIFLPMGIFVLVLGWRFRALERPRYMGIPMLGILPLVFNAVELSCRSLINDIGIWTVVSLGFTTAVIVFGAALLVLFLLSLIILAAQHA